MARHRLRDALAVATIVLGCAAAAVSPATERLRGLSLDALTALRWQAFGPRHDPAASPAVVIAIDEETYSRAPFRGSPTITWTREIGRVLGAVVEGGAAVVGFDIVFPTSIEQSELPFGDEPLGARLRGFDRDFLRALRSAAAGGRLVLGEVQHRDEPIRPAPGQRFAVGQPEHIRPLNAYSDRDDVVRRAPLAFAVVPREQAGAQARAPADPPAEGLRPSMALELAARAAGVAPRFGSEGRVTLSGYRVPSALPLTLTLNFEGGADDIPTYSLADLHACLERGDAGYFRRQFAGKVVLLGTVLDTDDRHATSKRFATGLEHAGAPRCTPALPPAGGQIERRTIAGVYIHATAVNNLLRRDAVREAGRGATVLLAGAGAALAAGSALLLAPAAALGALLFLAAGHVAGALLLFRDALALPLVEPLLAAFGALGLTVGWRFAVVDRDERFLRRSFGLYLAPQVIDGMLESGRLPALGGEVREVTVFFSDIAGFSSFSETLSPPALVALMNEYLSAMTDIVEDCGGYVDKYIGDSIVAVFGAPARDPEHARHAVLAALRCRDRLATLNAGTPAFRGHRIAHRIGINSGEALVGNIGSRRRFNYTVMSDAVNLASRLEGANKYFDTSILAAEATVQRCGSAFAWREVDAVRVKGRAQPVRVHEPLAEAGAETPAQRTHAAAHAEGLAAWRARDFERAAAAFERHARDDPPAARFAARARELAARPPGPGWEPLNSLEGK